MPTTLKKASIAIRQNKTRDNSPVWTGTSELTGEKFTAHFRSAMEWYRLEKSVKDLKPKLIEWMHTADFPKKEIDEIRKTKDKYFNTTMVSIAACLVKGMPKTHPGFNKGRDSEVWLRAEIQKVLKAGKNDWDEIKDDGVLKVEKSVLPVINIQDRLFEAASSMSEELDEAIDSFITDPDAFNPNAFKILNLLRGKGAKAAHTRYIKSFFALGHADLHELASGKGDEQLREAYRHLPRKNVKKLIEFYDSIMAACEQIAAEQKVLKKPRAKKTKPAEQLVAKLKFLVKDDKLGIVSTPPAQIVGATGIVLYNIRTRKLAYVISKSSAGIGVKGTSLLNFTDMSFQKTLRNPQISIKEFKEQNTQKRFETWFSKNIKTTETAFSGRMNEDTVILKVFK
jgi:hypothetical protein